MRLDRDPKLWRHLQFAFGGRVRTVARGELQADLVYFPAAGREIEMGWPVIGEFRRYAVLGRPRRKAGEARLADREGVMARQVEMRRLAERKKASELFVIADERGGQHVGRD